MIGHVWQVDGIVLQRPIAFVFHEAGPWLTRVETGASDEVDGFDAAARRRASVRVPRLAGQRLRKARASCTRDADDARRCAADVARQVARELRAQTESAEAFAEAAER